MALSDLHTKHGTYLVQIDKNSNAMDVGVAVWSDVEAKTSIQVQADGTSAGGVPKYHVKVVVEEDTSGAELARSRLDDATISLSGSDEILLKLEVVRKSGTSHDSTVVDYPAAAIQVGEADDVVGWLAADFTDFEAVFDYSKPLLG